MGVQRSTKSEGEKRPPNKFMLFRKDTAQSLNETRALGITNPYFDHLWSLVPEDQQDKVDHLLLLEIFNNQTKVSGLMSAVWKNAPADVKDYYHALQEKVKEDHSNRFPTYQFRPKNKSQKEHERQERARRRKEERENRLWAEKSIALADTDNVPEVAGVEFRVVVNPYAANATGTIPVYQLTHTQSSSIPAAVSELPFSQQTQDGSSSNVEKTEACSAAPQIWQSSYYDFDLGFWVVPSTEPPALIPEVDFSTLDLSGVFDFIENVNEPQPTTLSNVDDIPSVSEVETLNNNQSLSEHALPNEVILDSSLGGYLDQSEHPLKASTSHSCSWDEITAEFMSAYDL